MTTNNPLVDQASQFEWGDYIVGTQSTDYGGTSKWNPWTPGQGYATGNGSWLRGLPLLDSAKTLLQDVRGGKLHRTPMDLVAVWADQLGTFAAGVSLDWGGLIASPAASWAMEHVKHLRLVLDTLAGNFDMVDGVANTWGNMGKALGEASDRYGASVDGTCEIWQGPAADAYRDNAGKLVDATAAAGTLCLVWAEILHTIAQCVSIVHDLIRDLIAAAIGQLVQAAAESLSVVGAALLPQQVQGEIARVTGMVTHDVTLLIEAVDDAVDQAGKIMTLVGGAYNVLERLIGLAGQELRDRGILH